MIKGISNISGVSINLKPAFKAYENTENVSLPIKSDNLNGINALGNYNLSLLNVAKSADVKILTPISDAKFTDEITDGEKIYTSDNKLKCVIQENGNKVTIYYADKENPEKISNIEVNDKETGNRLMSQQYIHEDAGKYNEASDYIELTEYNPVNGKKEAFTSYKDGKFNSAAKNIYKPNGSEIFINKYVDGTFYIFEQFKERERYIDFDKNKQIRYVSESYEQGDKTISKRANFYKGGLVSVEKSVEQPIINNMGVNLINATELIPAPIFKSDMDYKGLDGEKTYYSNGMIESNKIKTDEGEVIAKFDFKGNIESLDFGNKKIEYENNGNIIKIKDSLEEGKTKETIYNDFKISSVEYVGDGRKKKVCYEDGKPRQYDDTNINDESDWQYLYFSKNGMLMYG